MHSQIAHWSGSWITSTAKTAAQRNHDGDDYAKGTNKPKHVLTMLCGFDGITNSVVDAHFNDLRAIIFVAVIEPSVGIHTLSDQNRWPPIDVMDFNRILLGILIASFFSVVDLICKPVGAALRLSKCFGKIMNRFLVTYSVNVPERPIATVLFDKNDVFQISPTLNPNVRVLRNGDYPVLCGTIVDLNSKR